MNTPTTPTIKTFHHLSDQAIIALYKAVKSAVEESEKSTSEGKK